ncbi:hypothetical protein ACOSQ4_012479 [Xanthoceras sorbifolium]
MAEHLVFSAQHPPEKMVEGPGGGANPDFHCKRACSDCDDLSAIPQRERVDSFKTKLLGVSNPSNWKGFGDGKEKITIEDSDFVLVEGSNGQDVILFSHFSLLSIPLAASPFLVITPPIAFSTLHCPLVHQSHCSSHCLHRLLVVTAPVAISSRRLPPFTLSSHSPNSHRRISLLVGVASSRCRTPQLPPKARSYSYFAHPYNFCQFPGHLSKKRHRCWL